MADENEGVGEGIESPSEEQQPVNLDSFDEFRKWKSNRDKATAAMQLQLDATTQQLEETQRQMSELIEDPAKRAEFQQQRLEAKLASYVAKDQLSEQRRWFTENYGVPAEILAGATNASDVTRLALDYQQTETARLQTKLAASSQEKETEETEVTGGHKASTSPGAPPESQALTDTQLNKEISDLHVVARKGGTEGERARVDALKLEARKQQSRALRAQV